jgi:hypothetical protein
MNTSQQAVTNAANLAFLMVNVSGVSCSLIAATNPTSAFWISKPTIVLGATSTKPLNRFRFRPMPICFPASGIVSPA